MEGCIERHDFLFMEGQYSFMDEKQRQRLIATHRDSFSKHGHSPRALFWESRGIQWARFKALVEIGVEPGDSVLDVGCGFGDLRSW